MVCFSGRRLCVLLLNRSLESELFEEVILTDFVFTAQTAGTNMVPIYLMITEKGRQFN